MKSLRRRTIVSAPAALAGAAVLARPHIASAAAKTLSVWWEQGLFPAENQALRDLLAEWGKASGVHADLTFLPARALNEKIVAALSSGVVPDLFFDEDSTTQVVPQSAWAGKLVDVSDVVATQQGAFSAVALQSARLYDNVAKKRSYYGVPCMAEALNIAVWKSLVEKAGYRASDIPKTWDAYFGFFAGVQKRLRAKGMRHVYGLGFSVSTLDDDSLRNFNQFLVAYGGGGIVTPDGKLHGDDPKVREAATKALSALTTPYKEGYVPPSAINWDGPDNNAAFHAREVVMTPNYTISIATSVMQEKQEYYHDIMTSPMPLDNAGKPIPALLGVVLAVIPKGAKNVGAAKDFLRYLIEPAHLNLYLKKARGAWLPVIPSIVDSDPYWLDPSDPHRPVAVREGVLGPTTTWPYVFNPAYAVVNAEQVWGIAEADAIKGMAPGDAVAKALARIAEIFKKYPIG